MAYTYQECPCGSNKTEGTTGFCGSCNRAKRKAETLPPAHSRKPLARGGRVNPVSAKQRTQKELIDAAYRIVDRRESCCRACGSSQQLTHSHYLPRGQFQQHEANPDNICLLCQPCHMEWEHKKQVFKQKYPIAWLETLEVFRLLEPNYLELFKSKHCPL